MWLLPSLCAAIPPGSVICSRNLDERLNTSIGHINHLAIVASDGKSIIEAQAGIGVQKISLAAYLSRPYEPVRVLVPCDREMGMRAARKAEVFVGQPYSKLGSIRRSPARRMSRGQKVAANCVVPIKAAYWDEDRRIRRLKIPDGIFKDFEGLFDAPQPLDQPETPDSSPAPEFVPGEKSLLKRAA